MKVLGEDSAYTREPEDHSEKAAPLPEIYLSNQRFPTQYITSYEVRFLKYINFMKRRDLARHPQAYR